MYIIDWIVVYSYSSSVVSSVSIANFRCSLDKKFKCLYRGSRHEERTGTVAAVATSAGLKHLCRSNTLLIAQYFKFELCSYQFNHFVWLTLLNLQASVLPGE